jgi:acyl-CoA thioesterase-1
MALLMNTVFFWTCALSNASFSGIRFLAALLAITVIFHTPLSAAADSSKATKILVLGDSLSAAYGIQRELGWVNLMRSQLNKSNQIDVANASISGETTDGGVRSLPSHLTNHQPDLVIIELGANDGLRGFPVPVIKKNLNQLISMSQESGAKVILIGIHIPSNYGSRYTSSFDQMFTDLAKQYQLPFVPFLLKGVALNDELMQDDGLHPTAEAQPILLANVMAVLSEVLATLP